MGGNDQYKLGPAIDRWVDPTAPGANVALRAEVSHRRRPREGGGEDVTDLGSGLWRYDYAVMNMDFSRPANARRRAEPARASKQPGLRCNFSGARGHRRPITDITFSDGDLDASNDWTASISNGTVTWVSANRANPLNWGTMFRFSFITDQAPAPARVAVSLNVAARGLPASIDVPGMVSPITARTLPGGSPARVR